MRKSALNDWLVLITLALLTCPAASQELFSYEVTRSRPHIRVKRPAYRNYTWQNIQNYPTHSFPYTDTTRTFYDPMGNFLSNGYNTYLWGERRSVNERFGSILGWDSRTFDNLVAASDGYGNWGYHAIVGEAMMARFTPLTLSKANYNGARFDLLLPNLQLTTLASRMEHPGGDVGTSISETSLREDKSESALLLGSRLQANFGVLNLGLNWVNQHLYDSNATNNGLKGRLKSDQPLIDLIFVRFRDDSPEDGIGGATIQEVGIVIDGELRPDLKPRVVSHGDDPSVQVGFVSVVTGSFVPLKYDLFTSSSAATAYVNEYFYREREYPLFADYLTRLDHEEGLDVSKLGNVPGLLSSFQVESPEQTLRADGEREVVFVFDLTKEPVIHSVAIEALVGNDYLIDVAYAYSKSAGAGQYYDRLSASYYNVELRAEGNVQDLSNLERVRFDVGEGVSNFVYGADMHLELPGVEISAEYARSSRYWRYPSHGTDRRPTFDESPRFADRGSAYFVNAVHNFDRGAVGAELFSIQPEFGTELRSYVAASSGRSESEPSAILNNFAYWYLVDDNEDGDIYPDIKVGNLIGVPRDNVGTDLDGVWLGQDADNDGAPDTNRNLNQLPDYQEPFLMFAVEPNSYVYGFDRNNNDEPDHHEDDAEVDYPYEHDERGFHLFAHWQLSQRWSAIAGHYDIDEIAGSGQNRASYAIAQYRLRGSGRLRYLNLESGVRKVEDDIADEYMQFGDDAGARESIFGSRGVVYIADAPLGQGIVKFLELDFVLDELSYRDSFVSESYLAGGAKLPTGLDLNQQMRLRVNWQRGGDLGKGIFQRRSRLDFFTLVSRAQYDWWLGKLRVSPKYKLMIQRLVDRERDVRIVSELRSIPILQLEYQLMSRTQLRFGIQGIAGIPYRMRDDTSSRNSFKQRTMLLSLTNRSHYFGYDLMTIIGVTKDHRSYDSTFADRRNFDLTEFFVRAMIGFTDFGRLI